MPCKAWAVHGTHPPACSAHAGRNVGAGAPAGNDNATKHGFYGSEFTTDELADLIAYADDLDLTAELATLRVLQRRLLNFINTNPDLPADDLAAIASLATGNVRAIAYLFRTMHILDDKHADGVAGAIGQALDELSNLWGVKL